MGGMAGFGKPTMRTGEPFRDLAAADPDPFADEKGRAAAKKEEAAAGLSAVGDHWVHKEKEGMAGATGGGGLGWGCLKHRPKRDKSRC